MFIYKNNDAIPWEKCVATVGFFDGVHGGHRFLLNEIIAEAHKQQTIAVAITFNTHPQKILNNGFHPYLLTTLEEKLELLSETGLDACVVLDFTEELSQLSAKTFIEQILKKQLHVSTLLVGYDHRFGHNREEGFESYKKYGSSVNINTIQIQQSLPENGGSFSSSQIRQSLAEGNIALSNKLLTYPYTFWGRVVGGYKNGRKLGFPTANIRFDDKEKIIPGCGVYAVYVYLKGKKYKGMMNIGRRPTFSIENELSTEVHIIDFNADIYDRKIKIECMHRIRDEKKFNGINDLVLQLKKDQDTANKLL